MAGESSQKKAKKPTLEYIQVAFDTPRRYDWSTGKYLGKFYAEAKENGRIVGNRCPKCREIWLPPTPVPLPTGMSGMGRLWQHCRRLPRRSAAYRRLEIPPVPVYSLPSLTIPFIPGNRPAFRPAVESTPQ